MSLTSSAAGSVQSPSRAGEEEHRIQPVLQLFLRLGAAMGVGQAGAASTSNPNVGIDLCQCSSLPPLPPVKLFQGGPGRNRTLCASDSS